MAEIGGVAFAVLVIAAVVGPIATLILGRRIAKGAFIVLFVSGVISSPLAAFSEPADFRGTAVIMSVLVFVFGLVVLSIASAIRTPRRRVR